jgi:hypothetical protein
MSAHINAICVVGLGPRGLSVLERLCANAADLLPPGTVLRVHLVDPHLEHGSRVWHTEQSPHLLMNTVASQITMFSDESVDCAGPVLPGPSLYEWARFMTLVGPFPGLPEHVRREARELGPDSYPTRAFYGRYLAWVLDHVLATAPSTVTVARHRHTAVDLVDEPDGRQTVVLEGGERISGLDAVVLCLGHTPMAPTPQEQNLLTFAESHDLVYVPPQNPADAELDAIGPGRPTLLRGLGLNFFDYMALFTVGRGGRFARRPDGRLRYLPSGREPRLIAGSRRGVPHHARGENQKGPAGRHDPFFFTANVVGRLRDRADSGEPVDFAADVWPLVDREVRAVYYSTLVANELCACDAELFLRHYVARSTAGIDEVSIVDPDDPFQYQESRAEAALLERFGIPPERRWDWHRIAAPYRGTEFADSAAFNDWLVDYLENDAREARRGNVHGAVKAALDVLRDLRNEVRLVVDHGGLSGDSYRDDLQRWYTPFNAFASIGPPVSRIDEMVALIEAGVLIVVGPNLVVTPDSGTGTFVARSPEVPGAEFRATALVEARLPETDLRRTLDPLLLRLLATGGCAHHRIPIRGGGCYETGGLAVSQRPYHLLDGQRRPHPRRFAFGVPTETVHWVTAAGIRPGVNSVILGDADAVARHSLSVTNTASAPVSV